MAESNVNVTEGSGKRLHTWNRTISATSVEDEFTLPGEFPYASYTVNSGNVATNTANDHCLQIMAGASLPVRIRRIRVEQSSSATAPVAIIFALFRLSTAGTGGTAVTPRPHDTADAASGATAMTLPTVKGTETVEFLRTVIVLRQALSATSSQVDDAFEWTQLPGQKPIIIPAGTANGVAWKTLTGFGAAGSIVVTVDIVETNFV